jgi:prolipoprotein diacylglyceryltransferase
LRKYGNRLKEGVVFAWFLISVFTARFFIEFVKFEQSDFEVDMIDRLNINMGQLLSIPFILLGIGLLLWIRKHGKHTQKPVKENNKK